MSFIVSFSQRCQRARLNFTGVVLQLHWPLRHNKSTSQKNLPNVLHRASESSGCLWTVTQNSLCSCSWPGELWNIYNSQTVEHHSLSPTVCKPHPRAACICLSICNHFERNYEKRAIINSSFSPSQFTRAALSTIPLPSGLLLLWHMLISKHTKLPV